MDSSPVPAIGIDLGTTNSCVAIYLNGKAEVLTNDVGERTTPSYVRFKDDEIIVGQMAKNQAYRNQKNTIFDVKRLIGRTFNDAEVQEGIKYWPFNVTDRNGNPKFKIKLGGKEMFYCPEQISAEVLKKLKDIASEKLKVPVTKAVITVPANFSNTQRQATKNAGKLAGLEVLMLLNEPTAAAITYAMDKSSKDCKHAIVFDLGAGMFDVSVVKFQNQRVTVKAVDGDSQLGGNDFDTQLLLYLMEDIQNRFNYNIRENPVSMAKLLAECERKKQLLSFRTLVEIELHGFFNGNDYCIELRREKFEDLNRELFQRILEIVRNCLKNASLTPSDIDNVVLVGGSTKIPKIKQLLQELFRGKSLSEAVNPDEAVAIGAAIQAANINKNYSQAIEDFVIEDVVPFSLGIEAIKPIGIGRNTILPTTVTKRFRTAYDYQTETAFRIYEGRNKFTSNNNLLGSYRLSGIPPAPKGVSEFEVTFDIDINGILSVTPTEKLSKKTNNIIITSDRDRLSDEELENMINQEQTGTII